MTVIVPRHNIISVKHSVFNIHVKYMYVSFCIC